MHTVQTHRHSVAPPMLRKKARPGMSSVCCANRRERYVTNTPSHSMFTAYSEAMRGALHTSSEYVETKEETEVVPDSQWRESSELDLKQTSRERRTDRMGASKRRVATGADGDALSVGRM